MEAGGETIPLLTIPSLDAKLESAGPEKSDAVPKVSTHGFTTRAALAALEKLVHDEQDRFLADFHWRIWLKDALSHDSSKALFTWTEILLLLIQVILAVVSAVVQNSATRIFFDIPEIVVVIVILLGLLCVNVALTCWDARSRHLELWRQVDTVMMAVRKDLQPSTNKKPFEWKTSHYPDLQSPDSPCISLQWTYRDDALVALPAVLLVPGDVILVRPSQSLPCRCVVLSEDADDTTKNLTLNCGDVFQPDAEGEFEKLFTPKMRISAAAIRFVVLQSPFLKLLSESFSKRALERPTSVIEKQRKIIWEILKNRFLPIVVFLYFLGNLIESFVFGGKFFYERWPEEFLYGNLYVLLPLSPLLFPSFWLGVNYIILARVLSVFQKFRRKKFKHDFLHEAKLTDAIYTVKADWFSTWQRFRAFVEGNSESLYQTSNIVHTLGNVTAVCCMDKKGILSWPNPNAEKICVLRPRNESVSASKTSLRLSRNSLQETIFVSEDSRNTKNAKNTKNTKNEKNEKNTKNERFERFERHNSLSFECQGSQGSQGAVPEVLDMTQSGGRAFEIEFDDPFWTKLLNSLKPIGLTILLNTCNEEVQEYYRAFTDHVSCVANHHDQTVPVVNRRCLCSLSHSMGFTASAQKIFKQIHEMAFYRKPTKTPRELEGRYKSPFPNMFSVILQDKKSGGHQVMTQGTADLILDVCSDYWNGQEVRPLLEEDRKHILEFYTRFSMTAYCTAFSYSPLTGSMPEQESESDSDDDDAFIELPAEDENSSNHEISSQTNSLEEKNERVEDLFGNCCRNQIFLGCVSQQYQSRNEFVHLIDLLEQACIRFIHFSPETELRSRVFAERLGLESGWNCHISLDSKGIDPTSIDPTSIDPTSIDPTSIDPEISFTPPSPSVTAATAGRKTVTTIVVEQEINLENRARLPRGIETVRQHIAEVDNVPLLVSLFTDCTPDTIKEMLSIMQENGEVVCCLGSSANLANASVFLQADASIGIEPMYPQLCVESRVFNPTGDKTPSQCLPTELMRTLTSLNCALSCQKEDPLSLMQLVIESRHNLSVLRNCFKFLIAAGVSLVVLHTLCNLICLPPSLSLGHILLLVCLSLPLISLSLLAAPHDRNLMRISTGKNRREELFNPQISFRFMRTFFLRWFPSVLIVLLCQSLLLAEDCFEGSLSCFPLLNHLKHPKEILQLTQNFSSLLVVLYFSLISMGYGNSQSGFWKYSPLRNSFWLLAVFLAWIFHLVYFFTHVPLYPVVGNRTVTSGATITWGAGNATGGVAGNATSGVAGNATTFGVVGGATGGAESALPAIPYWVWLTGFLWPLVLLPLNELIKRFELAELDKQQKRARLAFGTKLGMNSPF